MSKDKSSQYSINRKTNQPIRLLAGTACTIIPRRLKLALLIAGLLFAVVGIFFLILGIFAPQIGLDNDPGWGRGRIILAAAGGLLLMAGIIFLYRPFWIILLNHSNKMHATLIESPVQPTSILSAKSHSSILGRPSSFISRLCQFITTNSWVYAILAAAIAAIIYLWYITAGTMTNWTPYSNYFDRQAEAFRAGQLALLEEPGPELKALADPYNWQNREGVPVLWDASFYKGHYYLYWGPAPAMLAAVVKAAADVTVEDQFLLFGFCTGIALFFGLSLNLIRKRLYPQIHPWTVFLFTLLAGLALPVLWLINRPSVYETAIGGGQFFLVMGLYFALRSLLREDSPQVGWLVASGIAWGAAVACRLNLALAVVFFVVVIGWFVIRHTSNKTLIYIFAALILPLAVWAAGLAWYNAARFGSVFETGHRYQLTGPALPNNYRDISSPAYIFPNMYNYVFRPLKISTKEFPFVFAPYIAESMWPRFVQPPVNYYYSEPVAGIFPAVPAAFLAFFPLMGLFVLFWNWLNERSSPKINGSNKKPGKFVWMLSLGGFGLLLAPLLIFISSSMRYLADILPFGVLLAALGFWWAILRASNRPRLRWLLNSTAVILVIISISFSLLANFTNGDKRFQSNNPILYYQIAEFYTH